MLAQLSLMFWMGKLNNKTFCVIADKSNSWLRFRYGRLSVDSDDQNFNKKCDIDEVLVEYKVDTKCCDKLNGIDGIQCLDANGNQVKRQNGKDDDVECDCLGVEIDSQIKSTLSESNSSHQIDTTIIKKIQKMAISDDDYGENVRRSTNRIEGIFLLLNLDVLMTRLSELLLRLLKPFEASFDVL